MPGVAPLLGTLAVALAAAGCARVPTGAEADAAAAAFEASQPEYLRPFPYTEVPRGLADLRPETCGSCHSEIYAEWKVSTHARAWEDTQFQAELRKQVVKGVLGTRSDSSWMCINCHIPLVNQHERQVIGLRGGEVDQPIYAPNDRFQPELVDSAIGCAACHVRGGVVHGPYGDTDAPHPVARGDDLLSTAVCARCHQAEAEFPRLNLVCVFRTGTELAEGPYAAEGYVCQTCHMPEVVRPLVDGGPPRRTRRHWFGGSLIPKRPEYEAELAEVRAHYPDGLTVELAAPPAALAPGTRARVEFRGANAHAGHRLPTGDPERYIDVVLTARAAGGAVLAERRERIGTQYRWYPEVELLSDNRLAPRESRVWALEFDVPATGTVELRAEAAKYRLTPENLGFHGLEGEYVAGRTFLERAWTVPVGSPAPAAAMGAPGGAAPAAPSPGAEEGLTHR